MGTGDNGETSVFDKKTKKIIWGTLAAVLLTGIIFFFSFFRVRTIEVMGSTHYTQDQVKEMALQGSFMSNTVLASFFYKNEQVSDMPFVEGYSVSMTGRDTICISVKEKKVVGCIPYLDNYIFFDRNGVFVEGLKTRDEKVPFFDGIQVDKVVLNEKLPLKGKTILNTAVALATIFQKNDTVPDHIQIDDKSRISLVYGDVTVILGEDRLLEDKMTRAIAILPKLSGQKGILHMENITETEKNCTFEAEVEPVTAENWTGGYNENGEYTGDGEYDENGKYVGAKPKSELDYALENWHGGYDGEGDYTGEGEYDANWNYVGPKPTEESIAANGDWHGGYLEDGSYTGTGEYDHDGNYVGPNPNAGNDEYS